MADGTFSAERQKIGERFTLYVLFDRPVRLSVADVIAEAQAAYPGLDWDHGDIGDAVADSQHVTLWSDFGLGAGADGAARGTGRGMTTLTSHPGRLAMDWAARAFQSQFIFPEGAAAAERHTDHLCLSVSTPPDDTSVAARFDAARRLTCLGAVLALRPEAVAVYFANGETLCAPMAWGIAAETAMRGEVPVTEWISLVVTSGDYVGPATRRTFRTLGLSAFNGRELRIPEAQLGTPEGLQWCGAIVRLMLEAKHSFVDGDTLGLDPKDRTFRVRHWPAGQGGAETDLWVLFHPTSSLDDVRVCGPRLKDEASEALDRENWSALKDDLYSLVAGRP